jgi:pyruvate,water dikinase
MEFIINECIKIHPMALVHPEKLDDATRQQIAVLSTAYKDPTDFFIKTLAEGVATIAAAVYPKPCVVRMSDFKSNEYATLLGGQYFEPAEHNPIGFSRRLPLQPSGLCRRVRAGMRGDEMGA